jgi:S-layer family protein
VKRGRLGFLLIGGLALGLRRPVPAIAQNTFTDVPTENRSLYDAVRELASEGILNGYPDGTFGGRRAMTRWEFARALERVVGRIEQGLVKVRSPYAQSEPLDRAPNAGPFADVPTNTDSWRGDALFDLAFRGIIRGYPDATFAGSRVITHDESAVALQRMLQWVDRELAEIQSARGETRSGSAPQKSPADFAKAS